MSGSADDWATAKHVGDEAFTAGNYPVALSAYSQAISLKPTNDRPRFTALQQVCATAQLPKVSRCQTQTQTASAHRKLPALD